MSDVWTENEKHEVVGSSRRGIVIHPCRNDDAAVAVLGEPRIEECEATVDALAAGPAVELRLRVKDSRVREQV